jgi:hypothetical protein
MGLYITGFCSTASARASNRWRRLIFDASDAEAMRQRMQQTVCAASWSDSQLLARLATNSRRDGALYRDADRFADEFASVEVDGMIAAIPLASAAAATAFES